MTFFQQQIRIIRRELYAREDLTARLIKAKQFMDEQYHKDINLDQICREAFMSKYHFIRKFKLFYGRTPHRYLQEVRVKKAKELIRGGMTVRSACFSVGFDSLASFSTLFKKITGSPPSGIR